MRWHAASAWRFHNVNKCASQPPHLTIPYGSGLTPTSHPHSPFEGKHDFYNVDSLLGSSEQVAFHNLRGPFDFPKEDEAHLDVAGKQSQVQAKKKVM